MYVDITMFSSKILQNLADKILIVIEGNKWNVLTGMRAKYLIDRFILPVIYVIFQENEVMKVYLKSIAFATKQIESQYHNLSINEMIEKSIHLKIFYSILTELQKSRECKPFFSIEFNN